MKYVCCSVNESGYSKCIYKQILLIYVGQISEVVWYWRGKMPNYASGDGITAIMFICNVVVYQTKYLVAVFNQIDIRILKLILDFEKFIWSWKLFWYQTTIYSRLVIDRDWIFQSRSTGTGTGIGFLVPYGTGTGISQKNV